MQTNIIAPIIKNFFAISFIEGSTLSIMALYSSSGKSSISLVLVKSLIVSPSSKEIRAPLHPAPIVKIAPNIIKNISKFPLIWQYNLNGDILFTPNIRFCSASPFSSSFSLFKGSFSLGKLMKSNSVFKFKDWCELSTFITWELNTSFCIFSSFIF